MPIIAPILAFLTSAFAKAILDKVFFFLALKVFLTTIFIIVLPIVLNNLMFDMMHTAMNYLQTNAPDSSIHDGLVEISGLAAWLIDCLKISDAVAYLVSCLQLHMILKMIPFSPVK